MMGKAETAEWYDRVYSESPGYMMPYFTSRYYPAWLVIADRIRRARVESMLDLGCGPGQFACLMRDQGVKEYTGIDFSGVCIKQATAICPEYQFINGDIMNPRYLKMLEYDAVAMCEFLEHVDDDMVILGNIRSGTKVFGTVPDFICDGHVRCFKDAGEVAARYGHFMDKFTIFMAKVDNRKHLFLFEGIRQ